MTLMVNCRGVRAVDAICAIVREMADPDTVR